jgi:XRN 5'-3' exonuclease N-terminus
MGIPGFNTWFKTSNKGAYVPVEQVQVDHLYIDMNSVLHLVLRKGESPRQSVHGHTHASVLCPDCPLHRMRSPPTQLPAPTCLAADNMDKFHAMLHKRLNDILRATNPRKTVMLAIDGPAPLAKLVTQRERRKVRHTRAALTASGVMRASSTVLQAMHMLSHPPACIMALCASWHTTHLGPTPLAVALPSPTAHRKALARRRARRRRVAGASTPPSGPPSRPWCRPPRSRPAPTSCTTCACHSPSSSARASRPSSTPG